LEQVDNLVKFLSIKFQPFSICFNHTDSWTDAATSTLWSRSLCRNSILA